ncbi:hypothetical protein E2C01_085854 [Portunus trituberculatus]|uniref:Uncharacterized protein n=1 Tax=Portunus trituberculatus TaxID=210409 RepID=A0A5B7IZ82_PORTR|nr:hypothetical protein [Portunus trituberculatus]
MLQIRYRYCFLLLALLFTGELRTRAGLYCAAMGCIYCFLRSFCTRLVILFTH